VSPCCPRTSDEPSFKNLENRILPLLIGRVLVFDLACKHAYAGLMVRARETRAELTVADGYIAAITLANGFAVVTRAPERFEAIGVAVINPWKMKAA
jgi:predicted nucleic acid-binding protein